VNFRILAAFAALAIGACQRGPSPYPLPEQEPQFIGFKPHAERVLNMADADAPSYFLRDIQPDLHESWRWAMRRPAVKIKVHAATNVKYTLDFALPEITFRDTGPVTIAFMVNDHLLARVRYEHAGSYHFEKEVPEAWLTPGTEATVGAEIDKMWTSTLDGAQFGFIIMRMGLAE